MASCPVQPPSPIAMRRDVVLVTPGKPAHFAARNMYPEQSSPFDRSEAPPQEYGGFFAAMNDSCRWKERLRGPSSARASRPAQDCANCDNNSRHEIRTSFRVISNGVHPISGGEVIGRGH